MSNYITKRNIVVNSQYIRYYEYISPEKTTAAVIFLHGWRSNAEAWLEIAKSLQSNYTIYALDLPGFGGSEPPKKPFMVSDYAHTVETFIKKLNIKNPILIGHSFGGRIAIKMASAKNAPIEKIVLTGSAGIKQKSTKNKLLKTAAKIVRPLFKPSWAQGLRRKIYKAIGSEDYLATPNLKKTFVNVVEEDLTPFLPNVSQKTLLIWGEHDTETPLSDAKTMEDKIPHAELVILKNAGHFSFIDQPNEFKNTLEQFLNTP
jgi:pimeloyl-ACP methyl ester carboxylesterase